MSDCRKTETVEACITLDDDSGSVSILHTTVFDDKGASIAAYYHDENGDVIDEDIFLGGGVAEIGACRISSPECVESQEWTYGIDNTGTRFNDVATYEITLSDGSVLKFSQDGTSTNWTPQLNEWSANIQAAADAAGLNWFVEPRTVNNPIPTDISGDYGTTPTGLPGAPSIPVAQALIDGGMVARYVNIQICPGQPVPVAATRITSAQFTTNPYNLTTAGAILGPIQKFQICRDCGLEPVWYLDDGVTLADAGQIPNCYEPCGTLSLTSAPPDRDCTFQTILACDNNNSTLTTDFIPDITRRATICNGEQIAVDYFQADPSDPSALISYTLLGRFVDCATGQEIVLPPQPCEDFVSLGNMHYLTLTGDPATLVEWWADPAGTQAGTAAPHGNVSDIFTNDGINLNHMSGPADNSYIAPTFSVEGSNASDFLTGMGGLATSDTTGTDQAKLSAYFYLAEDAVLRDGGTRTGERGGLWLNKCCAGELELIEERTVDTTAAERGVFNGTVVPAGIHYAEALISDLSSWWNLTLEASFDGGVTYGPLLGYQDKPKIVCIPVIKCKDNGLILNAITMEVLDGARLFCENICAPDEYAKLCEIADLLTCTDSEACLSFNGFDNEAPNFWESGTTSIWAVNGDNVVQDALSTFDGTNVSTGYQQVIDYIAANSNFALAVDTDSASGKLTWRVEYSGEGSEELSFTNGASGDVYTFTVDASGNMTATALTSNGDDMTSETVFGGSQITFTAC